MQQFTVPQFIDVEDKIIGPITARQFVIMLVGFLFIGLSYKIFDFQGFVVVGICIFSVTGVFAFFRVNGMPFHFFVLNFSQTKMKPGKRVWNNFYGKDIEIIETVQEIADIEKVKTSPRSFSKSRLNELSLIVDTKGAYQGEELPPEPNFKNKHGIELRS